MNDKMIFYPVIGSEAKILASTPTAGWVWFAKDTKKIFYSNGETFLPMGGNSSVFYGIKSFEDEVVDEGQKEFEFSVFEIDGNDEVVDNNFKIPNVDDLILNSDGCFYRVTEIEGEGEETVIYTTKLTVAGSGNGDGTTDVNVGKLTFKEITPRTSVCLYKQVFQIYFNVNAVDAEGVPTGNGTYSVEINGKKDVIKGICQQGENYVDINPSMMILGDNKVRIYVSMDVGGSGFVTQSKLWSITTTEINLSWNYDETTINNLNNNFKFEYTVSGYNVEKTIHIIIDDYIDLPKKTFTETTQQTYEINPLDYGINTHGAHKVEMYVTTTVGVDFIRVPSIIKNVIFIDDESALPIISCNFFDNEITQYNTIQIPIIFYQKDNTSGNLSATLKENGDVVDTWNNLENRKIYVWNYTPIESTTRNLTIQCGLTEFTMILEVESLNINNSEVLDYTFRFKASDFSSNSAVQDYDQITFSNNFDWINGGLKNELDEKGNNRQYFCIRAGTTMTLNYQPFKTNTFFNGRAFKFIFKATNCRDYDAQVLDCYDDTSKVGLRMYAQKTLLQGTANKLDIPYCEDSYIEFEFDFTSPSKNNGKRYMMAWLDGVPTVFKQYSSNEQLETDKFITIGSPDCDVYVYLIKAYERHLADDEHLQNFIADAPNAQEMVNRYNRNDILDKERGVISPILLAEKNPDCRVHVYDISRMTLNKKDKIKGCHYKQYHGSNIPVLTADDVTIKVQGTSSASYGLAAFNIDSEFESGFIQADGTTIDGWSMNPGSIPVNYFCTKVNVASAEHANNALNQEWYNRYQPYLTNVRKNKPGARDTMEFTPGVLFIQDHNTQKDMINSDKYISNNLFAEIEGYVDNPYDRMYSICNMGNSKKNIEVLHDIDNPIEYCIEIADNQKPMQWLTQCDYTDDAWDAATPDWEFRYPDGHKEIDNVEAIFTSPITGEKVTNRQHAFDSWRRFITWMAKSNPQPAYEELSINSQEKLNEAIANSSAESAALQTQINTLTAEITILESQIAALEEKGDLITDEETELLSQYEDSLEEKQKTLLEVQTELKNTSIIYSAEKDTETGLLKAIPIASDGVYNSQLTYFTKTTNTYGYTNAPLESDVTYDTYTFSDSDYTTYLKNSSVTKYNGTYTHDTYDYRMAKMLNECENYLVMDSVIFHYLFIERHTMIDNVAKNTFWSTEDGLHWNLTKNYDNDTSDGNDNQGKLTLSYGIEPLDNVPGSTTDFYFNANQAVWFRFCSGIYEACRTLYNALESAGENGQENAWDSTTYLKAFSDWQKTIPERCWIEDYYRKYVRPLEIYGDSMFVDMLEGGQKTHQRNQYETYQNYYVSSKYVGKAAKDNQIIIRGNGEEYKNGLPVSVYADCYIQAAFGSGSEPNVSMRVKRNEPITIHVPETLGTMDNATIYFYLPQLYQTIGELDNASLNTLLPEQITVSPAVKLRTLVAGQYNEKKVTDENALLVNNALEEIGFNNNIMLEELYMCNYFPETKSNEIGEQATLGDLNLSNAKNLKILDVRNTGFTSIKIADGAPIETLQLCQPNTLELSNLRKLTTVAFEQPNKLNTLIINNIDNNNQINSKNNIIDIAENLTTYRLKNVNWTIDTLDNEIDVNNQTINILERLLSLNPYRDQSEDATLIGHAESLSGVLNIDLNNDTIEKDVAQTIYDKYSVAGTIKEIKYPNLNINFSDNIGLYTVTILNGSGKPVWERKLQSGYAMNSDDLLQSHYGSFNIANIVKPSTEYNDYTFTGNWIVKNADDNTILENYLTIENGVPIVKEVTANVILEPVFSETIRLWTITIFNEDKQVYQDTNCKAGTNLGSYINTNYPNVLYKDDSLLSTKQTYGFEGYGLSKTASSAIDMSKYEITSNLELYAIFKEQSVYENIHEDYFIYVEGSYTDPVDSAFNIEDGYKITGIAKGGIMGKITIPYKHNGKPVYAINNSAFANNELITHVFIGREDIADQNTTYLREIGKNAFTSCTKLKYFDFASSIRIIRQEAFKLTKQLGPTTTRNNADGTIYAEYYFGGNIYRIEKQAFNQALLYENGTNFIFSSTLTQLGERSFSYLEGHDKQGKGKINIYIGTANAYSNYTTDINSNDSSLKDQGETIFAFNKGNIQCADKITIYTTHSEDKIDKSKFISQDGRVAYDTFTVNSANSNIMEEA